MFLFRLFTLMGEAVLFSLISKVTYYDQPRHETITTNSHTREYNWQFQENLIDYTRFCENYRRNGAILCDNLPQGVIGNYNT